MHIIKPVWLIHGGKRLVKLLRMMYWNVLAKADFTCLRTAGERKDFEVYSCDVSPDGKRLVTAAGGGLFFFFFFFVFSKKKIPLA